ncbi:MAG: translocation protein TolB [Syntrophorhabdus sp. PtaU1.Bin058]|nr:MAG: translocation protein TolB [Syntrophorhabdus sp. PtaU1.Bin058]
MKKAKRMILILCALFAAGVFIAGTAEARVYLDIYGKSFKKITVAVPYFKSDKADRLQTDMSDLLNKDLDLSGFFIVAPQSLLDKEFLGEGVEKQEINFGSWRSVGIELLCKGKFQIKDGELIFEAFLYDTLDGSMMLAKRYRSRQEDWRRLVHRLADDILLTVTGDKGIMSSRIVFVGGRRGLKEIYMADIDGFNLKKITNYNNISVAPSVSPSGRYIAFTSYKEGRPNLYVKDMEGGREIVADRSDGMKVCSSWFNNSTLVYSHTAGKHSTIYTYNVATGERRTILQREGIVTSASFSPNGSKLLFVSDMYGSPQIFARDTASGDIKRLTYYGNYNSAPSFSPKGDLITFVSQIEGAFEISVMNADGSNQRVLTNGGALNDSPQFSPCGRYILYCSQIGGRYSLHIMLYNGENKRLLKFTDNNEEQPRFAP